MDNRKARHQQFAKKQTGWYGSLSSTLLSCSAKLLLLSLEERRGSVTRTTNNHFSHYAVGSITLLIDGLEAWLNESIWSLSGGGNDLFKLADSAILKKYYEVPQRVNGAEISPQHSLSLAVEVRNEITHFLPRIIEEKGTVYRHVPPSLNELYEQRLFFVPWDVVPDDVDLPLSNMLSSYRLAYWAWHTVAEAAKTYCEAVSDVPHAILLSPENFELYKNACPPSELHRYDTRHGLGTSNR